MARSDAHIARLEAEAAKWVGTPWCDNSAEIGRGVCCHMLMREIYVGAGWLTDLDAPNGSAQSARWSNESPILHWMMADGSKWFDLVNMLHDDLLPGDTLLLKVGHTPHHMGLLLWNGRVCHVTTNQGVQIVSGLQRWWPRITHAFRPR
jgi:cell wall-associated NlpC family hydrolase